MDLPPSSLHAVYQANEGIPGPSRRRVATVRKERELVVVCSCQSNKRLPHQGRSGRAGIEHQVLTNVAAVPPVVNEGKLKKCRSDAMER